MCLILDGCLVFAKSLGQGKTWAFKLVSLIPYFFYIPLTTQVSEARYPSSTLFPFLFGVSVLKLNIRKKATLILRGYWGT